MEIRLFGKCYEYDGVYYAEIYSEALRGQLVGRANSVESESDAIEWAWASVDLAAIAAKAGR
jgi:hypothetical protein